MILAMIVAVSSNNAIGKNNQLLWHLPADLKFFKTTTMGCPIIMGRKTYESIDRLLPGRKNIIVTRQADYAVKEAILCQNLETALQAAEPAEKTFIIGGSEIFRQSWHFCNEIYRTLVHQEFEGDAFFPAIDPAEFRLEWEEAHPADEKKPLPLYVSEICASLSGPIALPRVTHPLIYS